MSDKKDPKEKQLNIAIDENIADGIYSTLQLLTILLRSLLSILLPLCQVLQKHE